MLLGLRLPRIKRFDEKTLTLHLIFKSDTLKLVNCSRNTKTKSLTT